MIILDLRCDNGHRFEGWFASSDAFREQQARKLVGCPHCESTGVVQLPSAPYVRRAGTEDAIPSTTALSSPVADGSTVSVTSQNSESAADFQSATALKLFALLASMARQSENVGDRFPEEARRIHYDEAPARNIRGVATTDEALELMDEGIFVLPVPPENEVH